MLNLSGLRESIIGKELTAYKKEFGERKFIVTSVILGTTDSDLLQIKGFRENGDLTTFYLRGDPHSSYTFEIK